MKMFENNFKSCTFVLSNFKSVVDCLVGWGNEECVGRRTRIIGNVPYLDSAFEYLDARDFNPTKAVVCQVGKWTVFMDNHLNQWTPAAELYVLCKRLKTDTCFVYSDCDLDSDYFGDSKFNYNKYDYSVCGEVMQRQVIVYNDGKWVFEESGKPLDVEDFNRYTKRIKKDRLDSDMIKTYCQKLHIPVEFQGYNAVVLEWDF